MIHLPSTECFGNSANNAVPVTQRGLPKSVADLYQRALSPLMPQRPPVDHDRSIHIGVPSAPPKCATDVSTLRNVSTTLIQATFGI